MTGANIDSVALSQGNKAKADRANPNKFRASSLSTAFSSADPYVALPLPIGSSPHLRFTHKSISCHCDTPHREAFRWSSGSSSIDSTDVSEQLDSEPPYNLSAEAPKCGLCKRFLSHKSPWSTRRIVQSGDMPITGVLQCCHVYHAECLERTTPKSQKHDPPCPICERFMEDDIVLKPRVVCKTKHVGLSRLRSPVCGQVGDCMEGAVHTSPGKLRFNGVGEKCRLSDSD
ncbi:hypothetical protein QJS10_CPB21g00599 [Acorus calamus]|uniref:RING-type domain-containing protein n=1 Tax=Acorus calamus TaxID=4465 RepID=A0AAV9C7T7_ACOCL|nr:hypothetical protein QJS10_CPB21g00599 [Acorus calamus]